MTNTHDTAKPRLFYNTSRPPCVLDLLLLPALVSRSRSFTYLSPPFCFTLVVHGTGGLPSQPATCLQYRPGQARQTSVPPRRLSVGPLEVHPPCRLEPPPPSRPASQPACISLPPDKHRLAGLTSSAPQVRMYIHCSSGRVAPSRVLNTRAHTHAHVHKCALDMWPAPQHARQRPLAPCPPYPFPSKSVDTKSRPSLGLRDPTSQSHSSHAAWLPTPSPPPNARQGRPRRQAGGKQLS